MSGIALAWTLDIAIFYGLSASGFTTVTTHLLSFALGTLLGYSLIGREIFGRTSAAGDFPTEFSVTASPSYFSWRFFSALSSFPI